MLAFPERQTVKLQIVLGIDRGTELRPADSFSLPVSLTGVSASLRVSLSAPLLVSLTFSLSVLYFVSFASASVFMIVSGTPFNDENCEISRKIILT